MLCQRIDGLSIVFSPVSVNAAVWDQSCGRPLWSPLVRLPSGEGEPRPYYRTRYTRASHGRRRDPSGVPGSIG